MSTNVKAPDEQAPLLRSQPSPVDNRDETLPQETLPGQAAQTISLTRGILCLFALGSLIFLQGIAHL